jgi:hypothetical protein
MLVLVLTIAVIALAMIAMAIGVAISGRRLRGSCGGVGGDCACERQGIPKADRACEWATKRP